MSPKSIIILCDMKVKFVLPSFFTSESIFIIIQGEAVSDHVSETSLSEDCVGLSSQSDILTTQVKSTRECVCSVLCIHCCAFCLFTFAYIIP